MKSKIHNLSLDLNGITVNYLDTKIGDRIIVLLHGWALSSYPYRHTITRLAPRFRVIAPDLPSFGQSSAAPSDWSFEDYAEFTEGFIKHIGHSPAIVVGHSFGGGVGICLASRRPEIVRTLVLVDSAGVPLDSSHLTLASRKFAEMLSQGLVPYGFQPAIEMTYVAFRNAITKLVPVWRALTLPMIQDLRDMVRKITVPTIIMWAESDMMIPISSGQELARLLDTKLILSPPGTYHDWIITHPKVFTDLLVSNLPNSRCISVAS